MTTIEVKPGTRIGIDDILTGVANLDIEELDKFVDKLLILRAKRIAPNLSKEETSVLKKINRSLPPNRKKRLTLLDVKRSEGNLTGEEHQELLTIVDELEQLNIERVQYLGELAVMRGVPVRELIDQLGIRPQPYA